MIVAYACDCMCYVWEFREGGGYKTLEKLNFSEKKANDKLPKLYKLKTWKFYRSQMTKRTLPLDSSHKI